MMSDETAGDRAEAAVAADLMAHGRRIHGLSAAMTVGSIVALFGLALLLPRWPAMALVTLAAVLGIAETWFALRVGFDERAFRRMARDSTAGGLGVRSFDAAMSGLKLMPAGKAGRPMAARVRGGISLLGRQGTLLVLQMALLIASGWLLAATRG